jgi:hypothetical protein
MMRRRKAKARGWGGVLLLCVVMGVQGGASLAQKGKKKGGVWRVGAFSQAQKLGSLPSRWRHITFPKIKRHTRYRLVRHKGRVVVRADSRSSASGLARPPGHRRPKARSLSLGTWA